MVVVYTKPSCPQCDMTKKFLTRQGIEFDAVDVTLSEAAVSAVQELGYQALPVVVTGSSHWYGFRPDLLKLLA